MRRAHVLDPKAPHWGLRHLHSIWGGQSIYITENGCAASDVVTDDGKVYDSDRIMFLRAYLTQLQRATAGGCPLTGTSFAVPKTTWSGSTATATDSGSSTSTSRPNSGSPN